MLLRKIQEGFILFLSKKKLPQVFYFLIMLLNTKVKKNILFYFFRKS